MAQANPKNRATRRANKSAQKKRPNIFEDRAQHAFEHVEIKPMEIVQIPDHSKYAGHARAAQEKALSFIKKGDFEGAIQAYAGIYDDNPKDTETGNMLAALYVHVFKNDEAIKILRDLTRQNKEDYIALNNLAASYMRQFEYKKAEKPLIKALKLAPNTAEINHNAGVYYQRQGKHNEAIQGYSNAIQLKPMAESYCGLGFMQLGLKEYEVAKELFNRAIELNVHSDIAYFGLYYFERRKGSLKNAYIMLAKAINKKPDSYAYISTFVDLSTSIKKTTINEDVTNAILHTLRYEKVMLRQFFSTWFPILKNAEEFNGIKALLKSNKVIETQKDYEGIESKLNHSFFTLGIKNLVLSDVTFENLLTSIRTFLLKNVQKNIEAPLDFLYALSIQCFYNEYVFTSSTEEEKQIDALCEAIKTSQTPSEADLTLFACYRPVFGSGLEEIYIAQKDKINKPQFDELIRTHIEERREEEDIKSSIKSFGEIANQTSQAVKNMYEENPYPRWRNIINPDQETLLLYEKSKEKAKRKILIAGCGTGQQPVSVAYNHKNADITAIDLSHASLAYAIRKTKEAGFKNIKYMMGDILELESLKQKYDRIYCSGVLHHMKDPMAGWTVLNNLLLPGGTMNIGLYSEIARQPVVAVRDYIADNNIEVGLDNIRNVREFIKSQPTDSLLAYLAKSLDFYSISTCRDLMFHIQEHRFTLPQIKECLKKLNLEFHGFQQGPVIEAFKNVHPDPESLKDLEKWEEFEKNNPRAFFGMYQLNLKKPSK